MRQVVGWMLLALVMVGVALAPAGSVEAATVRGAPIDIQGLDDAGATAYQQQRFGIGRIAAMSVGGLGVLGVIFGYIAPGIITALGGFGSAFMPGAISSAFDAAPAADGFLAPAVPWLQMVQGFVGDRLFHDPLFLVCLLVAFSVLTVSRRQGATQGAA